MENKRIRTRIAYCEKAVIRTNTAEYHNLTCKDLSLNGAFLEGSTELRTGDPVEVNLLFTEEREDGLIKLRGIVVRNNLEGFAIAFYEMDEFSFQHLKRLIEYRTGKSDLIERELTTPTFGKRN